MELFSENVSIIYSISVEKDLLQGHLDPIKHLRWSFLKIVNGYKSLTIFALKLHRRCLIGS